MRITILLVASFMHLVLHAQDTLATSNLYNGMMTRLIKNGSDTLLYTYYVKGKNNKESLESIKTYTNQYKPIHYDRFYPNGHRMWQLDLVDGKRQGTAVFYNESGVKVLSVRYADDQMEEVLYRKKDAYVILGKADYYSVVYGGMENPDGTSNVSGGSGIYMYTNFYAVRHISPTVKPKVYKSFQTDFQGQFFFCAQPGSYGFFNEHFDIAQVRYGMGTPQGTAGRAIDSQWTPESPVEVQNFLNLVHIHFESVGYAP